MIVLSTILVFIIGKTLEEEQDSIDCGIYRWLITTLLFDKIVTYLRPKV
ncbi:MAG: hypothetical protein ACXAC7_08945 [Candidatus Hodarchaeales archaeon]